jgi:hypothetical protein
MASARWRLGDGEKSMYLLRLSKPPNGSAFPINAAMALRSSGQARIRPYDEEGVDDVRARRESKQRRHGVAVDAEEAGAGAAGRPHCDAPRLAALQPFLSSGEKIAQIAASSA